MEPFPPFCSVNPLNMQTHTKFQLQLPVFSILPIIFLLKGFQFQRSLEPSWPTGLLWLRHITTFSYQNTPGHREQHHVWLSFICSPKTHICIQLGSLQITSWMSHKYGLCSSLCIHMETHRGASIMVQYLHKFSLYTIALRECIIYCVIYYFCPGTHKGEFWDKKLLND